MMMTTVAAAREQAVRLGVRAAPATATKAVTATSNAGASIASTSVALAAPAVMLAEPATRVAPAAPQQEQAPRPPEATVARPAAPVGPERAELLRAREGVAEAAQVPGAARTAHRACLDRAPTRC